MITKGNSKHELYKTWENMKSRCFNPRASKYHNYGGRGITVCAEWKTNFRQFVQDMGPRPQGCTLDRIDVNGNYEPSNCRWATAKEQAANTRKLPGGYHWDRSVGYWRVDWKGKKVKAFRVKEDAIKYLEELRIKGGYIC